MRFSSSEKSSADAAFTALPSSQRENMQQSSVRLTNGTFTGSGVLVLDSDGAPGILTAKHNLWVKGDIPEPGEWDSNQVERLSADFLTNLDVGYGPFNGANPTSTQRLSESSADIEFRAGYGSWDYDLMLITFKTSSLLCDYIRASPLNRIAYDKKDSAFYNQGKAGTKVYVTGFGNQENQQGSSPSLDHPFQVRDSTVSSLVEGVERNPAPPPKNYNNDVLIIAASNVSSTAPGDSGGPVFTVYKNQVKLLGATLGANFYTDKLDPEDNDNIDNNAATYIWYSGQSFLASEYQS
ncbi:trypsin-like serine protease [Pseudenhygromyxa sp. WMMC2535]|uniref:trypsin-like serine protease n=1 Tax=Pseudenhygromyxa sp. WMMC2535 TaxID=2712867 RepID=UPI001554B398|nr:trypsin-like serine protease [Pseudenhygromyxa sp. WMMC2535]NVB41001.1 trypsin-like serine protease [Pseudenhygromyxa sp. WMMC2535]